MKRSAQFNSALWSFIAIPILLLSLLLFFNWDRIERNIAANANDQLVNQHPWAQAETFNRGRDVLIVGVAPHQQAVDDAKNAVLTAIGVRNVTFAGAIAAPLRDAEVIIAIQPESVLIAGNAGSQTAASRLIGYATDNFAPRSVVNQMVVTEDTAALPDLIPVLQAGKSTGADIKFALAGSKLTVSGELPDEQSLDALLNNLQNNFDGEVINQLRLPVVVENELCQSKIETMLAAGKINFKTNQSKIDPGSFGLLRNIADAMRRCPDASIQVVGHTDSLGSLESNILLSRERAESVVNAITEMGLSESRFEIIGHGHNKPVADNQTAAGRAKNRRIEFKIKN